MLTSEGGMGMLPSVQHIELGMRCGLQSAARRGQQGMWWQGEKGTTLGGFSRRPPTGCAPGPLPPPCRSGTWQAASLLALAKSQMAPCRYGRASGAGPPCLHRSVR